MFSNSEHWCEDTISLHLTAIRFDQNEILRLTVPRSAPVKQLFSTCVYVPICLRSSFDPGLLMHQRVWKLNPTTSAGPSLTFHQIWRLTSLRTMMDLGLVWPRSSCIMVHECLQLAPYSHQISSELLGTYEIVEHHFILDHRHAEMLLAAHG